MVFLLTLRGEIRAREDWRLLVCQEEAPAGATAPSPLPFSPPLTRGQGHVPPKPATLLSPEEMETPVPRSFRKVYGHSLHPTEKGT